MRSIGKEIQKTTGLFLTGILLLCISGCGGKDHLSSRDEYPVYTSYRDIPGVSEAESAAIEALKTRRSGFIYGMNLTTETFYNEKGEIGGFSALFCRWLTELFGIPFEPAIYEWDALIAGLDSGEIDFSGELTATQERRGLYYMTDPIAERSVKFMRISGAQNLSEILKSRSLRYAFFEGTTTYAQVSALERKPFATFFVGDYETAYRMLKSGEIDAFFDEGVAEAAFDSFGDVVAEDFFPLLYGPISLATQNPDLAPIISVVQKALRSGASPHLNRMYIQGQWDYQRHKLFTWLTGEEQEYIRDIIRSNRPVPIAAEYDNYPMSFYNTRERAWQGIALDVLGEIGAFTGLSFVLVNKDPVEWPQMMDMLETGRASMITELIYSEERKGRFLWPDVSYQTDYYALLSRLEYKDIDINEVLYSRVGIMRDTAYAEVFHTWFPNHPDTKEYTNTHDAFDALERGEVDLVMATRNLLLSLTNLEERPGFKANIVFKYTYDATFGFNKQESVLCSIVSKAMRLIDTEHISDSWTRRVFDYRRKMAQIPWLIGASALLLCLIVLLLCLVVKLLSARKDAEQATLAKSMFLANMSHEIRTPMNAIIGMSDLMPTENLTPLQKDYFEEMKKMSRSLLTIINDILDFSKIEAGKLEIIPVHYNMYALYDSIASMCEFIAQGKGLEFRRGRDLAVPEILYGDETRVRQIFTNIVNNAVKYTRTGFVSFTLSRGRSNNGETEYIIAEISDSGIGIKEEDIPKLFGNFQQLDARKNRGIMGTGLGLAITKNLLTMMNGHIEVKSVYGQGSAFTVYLPLIAGNSDQVQDSEQNMPTVMAKEGVRALVADDVPANLTVALGFLAKHGIDAETVDGGIDAVEKLRKSVESGRPYDIVFMDHMMPDLDGIEAVKQIRALAGGAADSPYAAIPIVALTANAVQGAEELFLAAGMNGFISKPIEGTALNAALKKFLPEEKYTVADEAEYEDTLADGQNEPLLKELSGIPGLNTRQGLRYAAGNFTTYKETLKLFSDGVDNGIFILRRCDVLEDWKPYAVQVHGFKGVCATIGASSLAEWGKRLEDAAKSDEQYLCRVETEDFCDALAVFNAALRETSLFKEEAASPKTAINAADFAAKLADFADICEEGLPARVKAAAEEIKGFFVADAPADFAETIASAVTEAAGLARSMDYDEAAEKLRAIVEKMKSG
ncbi:MAG: transporter substrate-binding domain-containing protein [Spirochaetales bacterium]|jgi:signal transduction histidine kinase/DNA-binding response OmpR family regulator|nr:transporter substrate-binding domain-containing protein [Spirochaetales bacterium]